jgi:hypothetical protein
MGKTSASPSRSERYAAAPGSANDHSASDSHTGAAMPGLDAEMLDLVQRFERGFAELAPQAEEPASRTSASDDLFPEFPDVFGEAAPSRAATESARVVPMPRREPEPAATAAPPPPWQRDTLGDVAADVDLDEAMAILRASEQRSGKARTLAEDDAADIPAARAAEPVESRRARVEAPQAGRAPREPERGGAATARASKSRVVRRSALTAGIAALAVGIAAGYFIGRTPSAKAPSAHIETSVGGGTQLRLERALPKPGPRT